MSFSYVFTSEYMQAFIANKPHKNKKKRRLKIKLKWVTWKFKYWSDICGFPFKASAAFLGINGSLEKSTSLFIKGNR